MKNKLTILTLALLLAACGKDNETATPPNPKQLEGVQSQQANRVQVLHSLECIRDNYGLKCDGYTISCNIAYYSNNMECKIKTTVNEEIK